MKIFLNAIVATALIITASACATKKQKASDCKTVCKAVCNK